MMQLQKISIGRIIDQLRCAFGHRQNAACDMPSVMLDSAARCGDLVNRLGWSAQRCARPPIANCRRE